MDAQVGFLRRNFQRLENFELDTGTSLMEDLKMISNNTNVKVVAVHQVARYVTVGKIKGSGTTPVAFQDPLRDMLSYAIG